MFHSTQLVHRSFTIVGQIASIWCHILKKNVLENINNDKFVKISRYKTSSGMIVRNLNHFFSYTTRPDPEPRVVLFDIFHFLSFSFKY